MPHYTLIQNAGAAIGIFALLFIGLKMVIMSHYGLVNKFSVFVFSLRLINKPQISGFEDIAMRSYIKRSNTINKMFYFVAGSILLLYFIINSALRN